MALTREVRLILWLLGPNSNGKTLVVTNGNAHQFAMDLEEEGLVQCNKKGGGLTEIVFTGNEKVVNALRSSGENKHACGSGS